MIAAAVYVCAQHDPLEVVDLGDGRFQCPGQSGRPHVVLREELRRIGGAAPKGTPQDELLQQAVDAAIVTGDRELHRAAADLARRARSSAPLFQALMNRHLEVAALGAVQARLGHTWPPPKLASATVVVRDLESADTASAPLRAHALRAPIQRRDRNHTDGGLMLVARQSIRNLLGLELPFGGVLGEATLEDVLTAMEAMRETAANAIVRGRFLRLVADHLAAKQGQGRVPAGGLRVRHVLQEAQLGRLYGEAEKDTRSTAEQIREQLTARQPAALGSSR